MLASNGTIHGWSPTGGDDEDVNVSEDVFCMTLKPFPTSPNAFLSPTCPPLDILPPKASLPESQSNPLTILPQQGVSHASIAPSSDRRAQRNRSRDPSWIPRPRNAFIIFRCEYSREHSQGAQDSQNDDDSANVTVKTLSKRAAEAWRQLPQSEKDRYKALADKEREEHARLYPHYRFRPMKRQVSGTKRAPSESQRGPAVHKGSRVPSTERLLAPATHTPSVLSSAPEKRRSSPSLEQAEAPASAPQVTSAPLPDHCTSIPWEAEVPLPEPPYLIDAQADPQLPVQLDYNDPLLFFSSPDSPSPAFADPYSSPLCSIHTDAFSCDGSAFGLDQTKEDQERAQALEAYAIGLYNFDLFSPFPFPEYG